MAISLKFVMIIVADGMCSRARESEYSAREETCPLEWNRSSDCRREVLDICNIKNKFLLREAKLSEQVDPRI